MFHLFSTILNDCFWITVSIAIAELTRDIWHVICHSVPLLYKHCHRWHHIAYDHRFHKRSEALWRKAEWRHGVPEASLMLIASIGLFYWADWCFYTSAQASLAGVLFSGRHLLFVILRGIGLVTRVDKLHLPDPFDGPPRLGKLNLAYHFKHHAVDVNAYFGAIYTPIDQVLGTALSFKKNTFALHGVDEEWSSAMQQALVKQWVAIAPTIIDNLATIDTLIIGNGDVSPIQSFFNTVQSNRDIACKELWWLQFPHTPSLPQWVKHQSPCTVRIIEVFAMLDTPTEPLVKSLVFQAKRHMTYIVLTRDPILFLFYRVKTWMTLLWLTYTKRF